MPLVSVVIPTYRVDKYIRRCLTSIQQQSLSDIEIIVVNDCTPDNTMAIVQELALEDKRIKIINLKRNEGPMVAREKGYMAATGDYITFCDGDDSMPSNAIELLYATAIKSKADIVSGNIMYKSCTGSESFWTNKLKYGNSKADILKSLLRHELSHNLCSKLFKAALLQEHEYKTFRNATNGEDACLFYQVVRNMNKMIQIQDVVYYYMQNTSSSSQKRRSNNALESICIANATIVDVASEFQELKNELAANLSTTLVSLICRGYNKNGTLSRLFSKYGLEDYCSNRTIIKSHSTQNALKLLLKKYVLRTQVG
jgi:glycosyltransferase involved in cell wall biosynthesis